MNELKSLQKKSYQLRREILDLIYHAKAGHIGGDMSVCDILSILYNKHMQVSPETIKDPNRDRFVLSKGHCVEALYVVLADRGYFPKEELLTVGSFGTHYIGHPTNQVNGIEMNTGSLGHGLSIGVGMALAGKLDSAPYKVYVVLGDGELAEGSVWEGANAAGHYQLDNLIAIIDRNHLQISGSTERVMTPENLAARFTSFGWNVISANGNDYVSLDAALVLAKTCLGKPTVIIANTTKGCGISFMENQAGWHHRVPKPEEYEQAQKELLTAEEALV